MSASIVPFSFESNEIRSVQDDNGEPLFVAKDIAVALGYANPSKAINDHCNGVTIQYPILDSMGRPQQVRVIQEPDLYRLIIRSSLPAAERFERWVFEEVLPQIRKTGKYQAQAAPPTDNARLLEAKTEMCKLGLSAFPDDAIMQSIVADAIKNTLGGQASLPAPALFQAYEILEEAGFTPKGIRSVGPTFGRLLAKAWREETGQQPLTTKRVVDGATRTVKCYPAAFKAQALGIAMGLH